MTKSIRTTTLCFVLVIAVGAVGCGDAVGPEPEFESLPIRDALRTSPRAMAKQSAVQRVGLAERLREQTELDEVALERPLTADAPVAARVEAVDAQLAAAARDAWLFAELDAHDTYRAVALDEANAPTRLTLPDIEEELERIALGTRGGRLIAAFVARSQSRGAPITQLQRAPQWPIALLQRGDTLYVNPSWLIAIAEGDAPPSTSSGGYTGGSRCTSSCGAKTQPTIPPDLDGLTQKDKAIVIEGVAAYFALDSIKTSIDNSCDRCADDCNDRCDKACDDACDDLCDDTFKCQMAGGPHQKRRITDGEVIAMAICLLLFPALQRYRTWRAGRAQSEVA